MSDGTTTVPVSQTRWTICSADLLLFLPLLYLSEAADAASPACAWKFRLGQRLRETLDKMVRNHMLAEMLAGCTGNDGEYGFRLLPVKGNIVEARKLLIHDTCSGQTLFISNVESENA